MLEVIQIDCSIVIISTQQHIIIVYQMLKRLIKWLNVTYHARFFLFIESISSLFFFIVAFPPHFLIWQNVIFYRKRADFIMCAVFSKRAAWNRFSLLIK